MARYTHGKSGGTSDRRSATRYTPGSGETSAAIKQFKLGQAGKLPVISGTRDTYIESKPLNVPGAIQIPDAPKAQSNHENIMALSDAFGDINTKLKTFGSEFWNLQAAMDKAARERAEQRFAEGEEEDDEETKALNNLNDSKKNLNKAKNSLETAAETDPSSANSWAIFHSMDTRTEREYEVVKAKANGLALVSGFSDHLVEHYRNSFTDENRPRNDIGEIIPLSPLAQPGEVDEISAYATNYFREAIGNTRAYAELTKSGQIQAAIYSARQKVSSEHAIYVDSKAEETFGTDQSNSITESLDDIEAHDLGSGASFTENLTKVANGASSLKKFKEIKTNYLDKLVATVNAVVPDDQYENEIINIENELLNTKTGPGPNDYLWKVYGSKAALKNAFILKLTQSRNQKGNILDAANERRGTKQAGNDWDGLLQQHNDGDWDEKGVQDITITKADGSVIITQKTNLEIMSDNYRSLVSNAQLTMSGAKRKAYITQLTNNYNNYMKGFGHQQQKENYLWILGQNPGDRPIYFKALINDWSANDLIDTTQATHLRTLVSEEYKTKKESFNKKNQKIITKIENAAKGYYDRLGDGNTTTAEEQTLIRNKLEEIDTELLEIFNDSELDDKQRSEQATNLLNTSLKEYQDLARGLDREKQGGSSEGDTQGGSGEKLTVNRTGVIPNESGAGGNVTTYIGETPRQILNSLAGGNRGDSSENLNLANSIKIAPLYGKQILIAQLNQLEKLDVVMEESGIRPNPWGWLQGSGTIGNITTAAKTRVPQANHQFNETRQIIERVSKHMSPKEYFINQLNAHNIPVTQEVEVMLERIFPSKEQKKNDNVSLQDRDEGVLIAGDLQPGMLSPTKDLETKMLDIIHSGESTIDVTGGGYEAFNQGGADEGETVLGFSGTYGDHPTNKGKKLVDLTIQEILDIQDSGYNTELYPFNAEGTKRWHDSGGIHAAGRYQFTRVGLREAMKRAGIKPTEKFTPEIQDKLAMALLTELGPNQWTSMKGNKELEELLKQFNELRNKESSTIRGRSDIA
tara:strand:+ start:4023 stop:7127 length:3105 start_codon:yes stop_codon:yes gene_type:complete